jgi:predicted MPP superfamily phosphohydrolase
MTRDALLLLIFVLASGGAVIVSWLAARRATSRLGRRAAWAAAGIGAIAFAISAWGRLVEPRWIEVTRAEVAWAGRPLRLAVLGDFHAGRVGAEVVARSVELANEADADVILLAGDFVSGHELTAEKATILGALRNLRAKRGVFAVLGNHDSEPYAAPTPRAEAIAALLRGFGIGVLENAWVSLGDGVTLIGVEEVQSGRADPGRAFRGAPEGPRIALTHDWHALSLPGAGRFDFAATGHSHGGQICVPFVRWCPFALRGDPYLAGLFSWPSGGKLFVTRGVGESAVLMRFACRPEVAVVDLVPLPFRTPAPGLSWRASQP